MEHAIETVAFEQPLNERTRSFLRLQFLLAELAHHRKDPSDWGTRAVLRSLLDIFAVLGRSDFKNEIIKDLAEQQTGLQRLRGRPSVDQIRLEAVLAEITAATRLLIREAPSHAAALLRENDFLYAIHTRSAIPGGTCEFDVPAYHRWLRRGAESIEPDLQAWTARLHPFRVGVELCLRLLRESNLPSTETATSGVYLHVPQGQYSLVRVIVAAHEDVYPEISASKHRVAIRFMTLGDVNQRNVQAARDISFQLQCCSAAGGGGS